MPFVPQAEGAEPETGLVMWTGHTGRQYRLLPESVSGFQLLEGQVHVLVMGSEALWSGSAGDVVADPQSRARFRAAMAKDVAVYRIEPPPDEETRVMVAWDILKGHPAEPLLRAG